MSVPGENLQIQSRAVAQPFRLSLVGPMSLRAGTLTLDNYISNGYVEKDPATGDFWVYKRPGLGPGISVAAALGRGIYGDTATNTLLWIQDNVLYYGLGSITSISTVTLPSVPAGVLSIYSFTSTQGSNNYVFMADTSGRATVFNTATQAVTAITDANYVTFGSLAAGVVYLDGTTYVMTTGGQIWGSAIGDPTTWPNTNVTPATETADRGVALARQLNYVVAMKQLTSQVFYDAGNATGSPLAAVQDAVIPYGCAAPFSVQTIDTALLWVSANNLLSPQVIRMDNLTPTIVSTPAVEKLLQQLVFLTAVGHPEGTYTSVTSCSIKLGGHRFYVISSSGINLTLAYDLDQNFWSIWTDTSSGNVGNFWPFIGSAEINIISTGRFVPGHIVQNRTTGQAYPMDTQYTYPTDNARLIPLDIYTPNQDFGTIRSKTLHTLYMRGDKLNSTLLARHTDDDYHTWSNFRQIDMSQNKPRLNSEGTFPWRRAYHFQHKAAEACRFASADLQMDVGIL